MVVKTPEQLEELAISDAIRSVVAIKTRQTQRELQNQITALLAPKIDLARLQGKRVNVQKLVNEIAREVTAAS